MLRRLLFQRPSRCSVRVPVAGVLVFAFAGAALAAPAARGNGVAVFVNGDRVTGTFTGATRVSVSFVHGELLP